MLIVDQHGAVFYEFICCFHDSGQLFVHQFDDPRLPAKAIAEGNRSIGSTEQVALLDKLVHPSPGGLPIDARRRRY